MSLPWSPAAIVRSSFATPFGSARFRSRDRRRSRRARGVLIPRMRGASSVPSGARKSKVGVRSVSSRDASSSRISYSPSNQRRGSAASSISSPMRAWSSYSRLFIIGFSTSSLITMQYEQSERETSSTMGSRRRCAIRPRTARSSTRGTSSTACSPGLDAWNATAAPASSPCARWRRPAPGDAAEGPRTTTCAGIAPGQSAAIVSARRSARSRIVSIARFARSWSDSSAPN